MRTAKPRQFSQRYSEFCNPRRLAWCLSSRPLGPAFGSCSVLFRLQEIRYLLLGHAAAREFFGDGAVDIFQRADGPGHQLKLTRRVGLNVDTRSGGLRRQLGLSFIGYGKSEDHMQRL